MHEYDTVSHEWGYWQDRHQIWELTTYGEQPGPERYALGVAEESLLELMTALDDVRHGGATAQSFQRQDAVRDAFGDTHVFLMGLCSHVQLDFGTLWDAVAGFKPEAADGLTALAQAVGRLCRACLKTAQGCRGLDKPEASREAITGAVLEVMLRLRQQVRFHSWDRAVAVRETLELVLKRTVADVGRPL